jgi:hypothetical protein
MAVSMMAVSSAGKAKVKSLARMISSSTQPRRAAARQPSATPRPRPMPTATTPTTMLFCAPTSSWLAMSRPKAVGAQPVRGAGPLQLGGMSISAGG